MLLAEADELTTEIAELTRASSAARWALARADRLEEQARSQRLHQAHRRWREVRALREFAHQLHT